MKIYLSNKLLDQYETSFPFCHEIKSARELQEIAARSDYCMAEFMDGYTQNGCFKKNHRARIDFLKSDVLYGDIDNDGCSLTNQFSIQDFENKFASYEYYITTSKSHHKQKGDKPPLDRYHVLFPLESEVANRELHKEYLRILHKKLFGLNTIDKNCIDVARMFYGNPNNETYYHFGKSIQSEIKRYYEIENRDKPEEQVSEKCIKVSEPIKRIIIPSLDEAYRLGWFDDYGHWINLGIALKEADYDVSVWLRYCHTEEDVELAEKKWDTFHPDGSLNGMKYLYQIHQKLNFRKIKTRV